uniref:Uncharacterized protein n=1 Tax=Ditylenchus dipsaci TaxID=166011 RepID=A0A915D9P0_9BILA
MMFEDPEVQDFEDWFDKFNVQLSLHKNFDDNQKVAILRSCLSGLPYQKLKCQPGTKELSYDECIKELRLRKAYPDDTEPEFSKRILELLKLRLRGDLLDDLRRDSVWRNGSLNQFWKRLKTSAAELVQEMQALGLVSVANQTAFAVAGITRFQQEKEDRRQLVGIRATGKDVSPSLISNQEHQPASPLPDSQPAYGQSPELRYDSQFRQPDFRYDDQYRKPAFRDLFNQKMFNAMLVMVLVILLTSVLTTIIEILVSTDNQMAFRDRIEGIPLVRISEMLDITRIFGTGLVKAPVTRCIMWQIEPVNQN